MGPRDPLPNEEAAYRGAISTRNEAAYRQLFELYPNVFWGSITKTLSEADKKWATEVCQKMSDEGSTDEDGW